MRLSDVVWVGYLGHTFPFLGDEAPDLITFHVVNLPATMRSQFSLTLTKLQIVE
jgi:hypothetical protein